jgi:predicted molibdopterin-dependent oxidoreductase YjgC
MSVKLTIDGKEVEAGQGATILQAAREHGIYIPTLCDNPALEPYGGCRLCLVEVEGMLRPTTSCTTPVTEGMKVRTSTPTVERLRKTVIELLLSDHPNDCMICERAGDCKLQEFAYHYGLRENRFYGKRRQYTKTDGNPFIERNMDKCILCGLCVRVCNEVQGVGAIDIAYRGFDAKVCPSFERDLDCEFCGQCVSVCPTGALSGRIWANKGRTLNVKEVETTCSYCGCGCTLNLHVRDNEIARVSSKPDTHNEGWLCVKGRFGNEFITSPDRLKTPLIKKDGKFTEASWEEAISYITTKLKKIVDSHGPDAVAGLSSARCTNEENFLFQKFMRAVIGTNNVDHCARL